MESIIQDVRIGIRMLTKTPVFTLVAIITLAVGIGSTSAIFSVIEAVLLRPLPYGDPDKLVKVWEKRSQLPKGRISFADFNDWKTQNHVFEQIAAYQTGDRNLTGGDQPEQIEGASVSANLFETLRVRTMLGRTFPVEEERPGANPVAILSHGLWERRFGSDPKIVGGTIIIDNRGYTVVGIMPADFNFPSRQTDLWLPLAINRNSPMAGRGMHILEVIGRLKSGVSVDQARAEDRK